MSRVPGQPFPMPLPQPMLTPVRRLLLPYHGVLTVDATGIAKTLWDGRDRDFGEQPHVAEVIWLTAFTENSDPIYLGARSIDVTVKPGLDIPPGERFPPLGPLSLKDWWYTGTVGNRMRFLYYPAQFGTFLDGEGRVVT